MRADFRVFESPAPGNPIGKIILRPETPEELAEMDEFRRRVGRQGGGDKMEIVFFEKKPRPAEPDAAQKSPAPA